MRAKEQSSQEFHAENQGKSSQDSPSWDHSQPPWKAHWHQGLKRNLWPTREQQGILNEGCLPGHQVYKHLPPTTWKFTGVPKAEPSWEHSEREPPSY